MSDIKVDSISNLAGTGAPDFPNGIISGTVGQWKKKQYSGLSSDLDFTLENGKWYEINVYLRSGLAASTGFVSVRLDDGSGTILHVLQQNINTASSMIVTGTGINKFQMTGTSLSATVSITTGNTLYLSYVIVTEIQDPAISGIPAW